MANGRTAREEKIIKAMVAGTSPAALAVDTGWDEALITREYHRIASEFDTVMDDRQQLQISKLTLRRHIARLEAEAEEGNKDAWKPLIDALSRQGQQIDKSLERAQADLEKVNQAHIRKMIQIVEGSVYQHYRALAERTGVPFEELITEFKTILQVEAARHDDDSIQ